MNKKIIGKLLKNESNKNRPKLIHNSRNSIRAKSKPNNHLKNIISRKKIPNTLKLKLKLRKLKKSIHKSKLKFKFKHTKSIRNQTIHFNR